MSRYTGPSWKKSRRLGFSLSETMSKYFKIEVLGKGNSNNVTTNVMMVIDKASINTIPSLSFQDSEVLKMPLVFNILQSSNTDSVKVLYY